MAAVTAVKGQTLQAKTGIKHNVNTMKCAIIEVPATANNGDTVAIDLAANGITTLWGFGQQIQTTANSVIAEEASPATTSVTGSILTVTIGGATGTKKRTIFVWGV